MAILLPKNPTYLPLLPQVQLSGKTDLGRVIHDVGATVLKAVVQPFASFVDSGEDNKIFNPDYQTKTFEKIDSVVNVFNDIGHSLGKAVTSSYTGGAVTFDSDGANLDLDKALNTASNYYQYGNAYGDVPLNGSPSGTPTSTGGGSSGEPSNDLGVFDASNIGYDINYKNVYFKQAISNL